MLWKSCGTKLNPKRCCGNPVDVVEIQWMNFWTGPNPKRCCGNPVAVVEIQWMNFWTGPNPRRCCGNPVDDFLDRSKSKKVLWKSCGCCGNPVDDFLDHGKSIGLKFGRVHHAFGLVQITKNTTNPKT